jgi:hypothetical protein
MTRYLTSPDEEFVGFQAVVDTRRNAAAVSTQVVKYS